MSKEVVANYFMIVFLYLLGWGRMAVQMFSQNCQDLYETTSKTRRIAMFKSCVNIIYIYIYTVYIKLGVSRVAQSV
jgi:hypothetical protein